MLVRRQAGLRRRPSQERSSFTFNAILDAAQQVVLSEGLAALHMSALGKRAGVSRGTLYQYFPDPISVVMALADRSISRVLSDLARTIGTFASAPLDVFVEHLAATAAETVCRDHALHRSLQGALDSATSGEPVDLTGRCAEALSKALQAHIAAHPDEIYSLAKMMVWAADGLLDGALREETVVPTELRRALTSIWRAILLPSANQVPSG